MDILDTLENSLKKYSTKELFEDVFSSYQPGETTAIVLKILAGREDISDQQIRKIAALRDDKRRREDVRTSASNVCTAWLSRKEENIKTRPS